MGTVGKQAGAKFTSAAQSATGALKPTVDDSQLRAFQSEVSGAQTNIDVGSTVDDSALRQFQSEVSGIHDESVHVQGVVDDSQLQNFQSEVNAVDGKSISVDADTSSAKDSLRNLEGTARDSGTSAGDAAGAGFMAGMSDELKGLASKAGPIGVAIAAAAGVATVGGVIIAKQLAAGMSRNTTQFNFQAALGFNSATAAKFASAAGEAYANNFGASFAANLDTARAALTTGLLNRRSTASEIQAVISQLSQVSDTLGFDIPEAARAAGQMLRTGLAKNAEQAFDIIVKGSQLGLNSSDDLLDTLNEYGTQFRKLGLNGGQALALISQMLKGGARDSDVAADALKEFAIRAVDGSDQTRTAFQQLGFNADVMTEHFAHGGAEARNYFAVVVDAIQRIHDPAKRAQLQVALFGTQAEDLGGAINKLDPSKIVRVAGATDRLIKRIGNDPAQAMEQARRSISGSADQIRGSLATAFAPLIKDFAGWVSTHRVEIIKFFSALGDGVLQMGIVSAQVFSKVMIFAGNLTKGVGNLIVGYAHLTNAVLDWGVALATASGNLSLASTLNNMRASTVAALNSGHAAQKLGQGYIDAGKAAGRLVPKLKDAKRQYDETTAKTIHNLQATERLNKVLEHMPKKVATRLEALNYKPTLNQLEHLIDTTKLQPRQVKTLVQALGVKVTEAQLRTLIDHTKDLDRQHPNPRMDANPAPALQHIAQVQRALSNLHDKTVTITTRQVGGNAPMSNNARGGYIVGPGTATSDSIPARLSNGEFVMRAAAVDKYGVNFMRRMNDLRLAGGGPVGTPAAAFPSSVRLVVPGREFNAYVEEMADSRIDAYRAHDKRQALR